MAVKTITVLDPTARTAQRHIPAAPAIHDLNDKVIGLLWNRKANGDLLLRRIAEQLSRSFHLGGTIWQQKASGAVPAGAAAIEELASNCGLVINAVGDWGSCSTWCIHDSVELEKQGKPTITICTDRFQHLARTTAETLGLPGLFVVVTPHPVGELNPEEIRAKADRCAEEIVARLLTQ